MGRTKAFDENQTLERALRLFWQRGYHATSIQDLVEHLGINRASMYDTYSDKRSLYLRALRRYEAVRQEKIAGCLEDNSSPQQQLAQLFDRMRATILTDQDRKGCFLLNAALELVNEDTEVAQLIRAHRAQREQALKRVLESGQAIGMFSHSATPESLARFIGANLDALFVCAKAGADGEYLRQISEMTLRAVQPDARDAYI